MGQQICKRHALKIYRSGDITFKDCINCRPWIYRISTKTQQRQNCHFFLKIWQDRRNQKCLPVMLIIGDTLPR